MKFQTTFLLLLTLVLSASLNGCGETRQPAAEKPKPIEQQPGSGKEDSGNGPAEGDTQYARPELLLEPAELAKPEVAGQHVILDARAQEEYDRGHVPGARRVDHDSWKEAFGDGKDVEGWSARIGELGIGPDSKVVVYDDKSMKDAARVWWILRYWGIENVRLLWRLERLAVG
jgi:rhodanese-related sulfurtransferase